MIIFISLFLSLPIYLYLSSIFHLGIFISHIQNLRENIGENMEIIDKCRWTISLINFAKYKCCRTSREPKLYSSPFRSWDNSIPLIWCSKRGTYRRRLRRKVGEREGEGRIEKHRSHASRRVATLSKPAASAALENGQLACPGARRRVLH